MDDDPIGVSSARKISGKAQAGKDMEDYFGFEVSPDVTTSLTKFDFNFFPFFVDSFQDEDDQIEEDHEISKSTIQLINFSD